jgi:NADH-quinone oxidoreductase subunit N
VTALFAVAPKIAAISLMVSVLMGPFKPLFLQWQQIIVVASVLSMALGAFAALRQQNIKRLMAILRLATGYILLVWPRQRRASSRWSSTSPSTSS